MREIKFRAKSTETKLHTAQWRFGSLLMPSNEACKPAIFQRFPKPMRDGNGYWYEVEADTVGQYTGKKDVNKKEIFEGDVVFFLDDRAHERIGVIKWHEKMYCWIIDCGEAGRDMLAYYACEIRGNVHDNPELIKK